MRCNCKVSKVLFSASSQNLYDLIGPMTQSEVINCVLFSSGKFPSKIYLEVEQSGVQGKSSIFFTAIT